MDPAALVPVGLLGALVAEVALIARDRVDDTWPTAAARSRLIDARHLLADRAADVAPGDRTALRRLERRARAACRRAERAERRARRRPAADGRRCRAEADRATAEAEAAVHELRRRTGLVLAAQPPPPAAPLADRQLTRVRDRIGAWALAAEEVGVVTSAPPGADVALPAEAPPADAGRLADRLRHELRRVGAGALADELAADLEAVVAADRHSALVAAALRADAACLPAETDAEVRRRFQAGRQAVAAEHDACREAWARVLAGAVDGLDRLRPAGPQADGARHAAAAAGPRAPAP